MNEIFNIVCDKCKKDSTIDLEKAREYNKDNRFVCEECKSSIGRKNSNEIESVMLQKKINELQEKLESLTQMNEQSGSTFGGPLTSEAIRTPVISTPYYYTRPRTFNPSTNEPLSEEINHDSSIFIQVGDHFTEECNICGTVKFNGESEYCRNDVSYDGRPVNKNRLMLELRKNMLLEIDIDVDPDVLAKFLTQQNFFISIVDDWFTITQKHGEWCQLYRFYMNEKRTQFKKLIRFTHHDSIIHKTSESLVWKRKIKMFWE